MTDWGRAGFGWCVPCFFAGLGIQRRQPKEFIVENIQNFLLLAGLPLSMTLTLYSDKAPVFLWFARKVPGLAWWVAATMPHDFPHLSAVCWWAFVSLFLCRLKKKTPRGRQPTRGLTE